MLQTDSIALSAWHVSYGGCFKHHAGGERCDRPHSTPCWIGSASAPVASCMVLETAAIRPPCCRLMSLVTLRAVPASGCVRACLHQSPLTSLHGREHAVKQDIWSAFWLTSCPVPASASGCACVCVFPPPTPQVPALLRDDAPRWRLQVPDGPRGPVAAATRWPPSRAFWRTGAWACRPTRCRARPCTTTMTD